MATVSLVTKTSQDVITNLRRIIIDIANTKEERKPGYDPNSTRMKLYRELAFLGRLIATKRDREYFIDQAISGINDPDRRRILDTAPQRSKFKAVMACGFIGRWDYAVAEAKIVKDLLGSSYDTRFAACVYGIAAALVRGDYERDKFMRTRNEKVGPRKDDDTKDLNEIRRRLENIQARGNIDVAMLLKNRILR